MLRARPDASSEASLDSGTSRTRLLERARRRLSPQFSPSGHEARRRRLEARGAAGVSPSTTSRTRSSPPAAGEPPPPPPPQQQQPAIERLLAGFAEAETAVVALERRVNGEADAAAGTGGGDGGDGALPHLANRARRKMARARQMGQVLLRQIFFEPPPPPQAPAEAAAAASAAGPAQPPPRECVICGAEGADAYPELGDGRVCGQLHATAETPIEVCHHWYHQHCLVDHLHTYGPVCSVCSAGGKWPLHWLR